MFAKEGNRRRRGEEGDKGEGRREGGEGERAVAMAASARVDGDDVTIRLAIARKGGVEKKRRGSREGKEEDKRGEGMRRRRWSS